MACARAPQPEASPATVPGPDRWGNPAPARYRAADGASHPVGQRLIATIGHGCCANNSFAGRFPGVLYRNPTDSVDGFGTGRVRRARGWRAILSIHGTSVGGTKASWRASICASTGSGSSRPAGPDTWERRCLPDAISHNRVMPGGAARCACDRHIIVFAVSGGGPAAYRAHVCRHPTCREARSSGRGLHPGPIGQRHSFSRATPHQGADLVVELCPEADPDHTVPTRGQRQQGGSADRAAILAGIPGRTAAMEATCARR